MRNVELAMGNALILNLTPLALKSRAMLNRRSDTESVEIFRFS
jgi:hypothetical protein